MDVKSTSISCVRDIKQEDGMNICCSCLSNDRVLSSLKDDADLFSSLLGHQAGFLMPNLLFVCWECKAVLRKIRKFRHKIQQAHNVLLTLYTKYLEPKSLSSLTIVKLNNLDTTTDFHENKEVKITNEQINFEVPRVIVDGTIKDPHTTDDKENMLIDIKLEENSDYEPNEISDYHDVTEQNNKIKLEKNQSKKGGNYLKYQKFVKYAKIRRNPNIDLDDVNSCFDKYNLTESDIQNLGRNIKTKILSKQRLNYMCCKECKKIFDSCLDLKRHKTYRHILNRSTNGPLNCLECDKECFDTAELRSHWIEHNEVMKCKECKVIISASCPSMCKSHAKSHEWYLTCNLCTDWKRIYRSYKEYGYHYRSLHKHTTCDYCGKKCKTKNSVLKHIRLKHASGPPVCEYCHKRFKDAYGVRRHVYLLHPEKTERSVDPELTYCVECDKQFTTVYRYRAHLAKTLAHNPKLAEKKTIVPCPECGKQFSRRNYMNNHYKLYHQKETKHYCALCDKYLVTAWSMKQHIRGVHQKIKDPKNKICDLCGRAFSTNTILTKHRRTHTGERPFRCKLCPATFTQSSPLTSHMRTQHKQL